MSRKLFTNVLLLTPKGRFVPGSILVDGGIIRSVIPTGSQETTFTDAEVIDLNGRHMIPGFVDAHFHLLSLALKRLRCDLSAAKSASEVKLLLADWLRVSDPAWPAVGVDWDESAWDQPDFPTRSMLDAIDTERPIFARRICGHVGVVNGAFLALLRGPAGFIDRDSGVITESAVAEATRLSYPAAEAVKPAVEAAIGELHRIGVTGIHDIVEGQYIDAYLDAVCSSPLGIRIDGLLHVGPDEFGHVRDRTSNIGAGRFRAVGIKLYADGSLGGRTAALHSSYSDAQTIGEFLLDEVALADTLRKCCEGGFTCAVHAIGDRALRTVLLEMSRFPSDTALFRIEHAELTGWDEIRMLEKTPVYLAMQPNFVRNWQQPGGLYSTRLGEDRRCKCNRFGSLRRAGVPFMFGSDGMPPGPLYGLRGATHHPVEEECIPLADALRRYTEAPNRLGAYPRPAGELVEGNVADFVVLGGNPDDGDPDSLRVEETYMDGERVFRAPSHPL